MTVLTLPHHARDEPGLAPRRLDFLFQEAVRGFSGISRPRIGPGPALVVAGAGRLALIVAVAAFQFETAIIAAGPVDRGLDRAIARFDHAAGDVGRVVEAPGPAPPVALAYQRAIRRIARLHRRTLIIAARPIEIGLSVRRSRGGDGRQKGERHQTRPEQAATPHRRLLSVSP